MVEAGDTAAVAQISNGWADGIKRTAARWAGGRIGADGIGKDLHRIIGGSIMMQGGVMTDDGKHQTDANHPTPNDEG
jgi:hypothetical protein